MARKGRKQLAVQILDASFVRFEEIKQETGLSNAKLIEMLIQNYDSTNTNKTNINTSTNTGVTEERVAEMIQAALASLPAKERIVEKRVEVIIERDEDGNVLTEYIDETPEWQNRKLEPQEFYGKVTTYEKGEFDHDPLKYLDPIDEDEKPSKPKVIDEYDEPLW